MVHLQVSQAGPDGGRERARADLDAVAVQELDEAANETTIVGRFGSAART